MDSGYANGCRNNMGMRRLLGRRGIMELIIER